MKETIKQVMAAMSAEALACTSPEQVGFVLEALAKMQAAPDPVQLLEIARATGLRGYLHGVNATDAREMLAAFVAAVRDRVAAPASAQPDRGAALVQQSPAPVVAHDAPEARASQPEGATLASQGATTEANQTAEEVGEAFFAQERTIHRLEDEIADLRAQLAAKGQGERAGWFCETRHHDGSRTIFQVREGISGAFELYRAAPASAQPAESIANWLRRNANAEKDTAKRAALVEAHNAARQIIREASAQPDRGAAQGIDVCAEMRALCSNCGGTGEVHRADGEYLGACDCMFQTIASPASQPVAPEATQAVPSNASVKDMLRWLGVDTDYHGKIAFTLGQFARFVEMLRAAVAPSNAKDAALNDLPPLPRSEVSKKLDRKGPEIILFTPYQMAEYAHAAKAEERALLNELAEAADVFMNGGVAPLRPLVDKVRAAMAAAPSSEKGGA